MTLVVQRFIFVVAFVAASLTHANTDIKHQLSLVLDGEPLARCLDESPNPHNCINQITTDCRSNPLVTSEILSAYCAELELNEWDHQLNFVYQQLIKRLREVDNIDGRSMREDSLRTMQRSWIRYRDGRCEFVRALAGTHLGAAIERTECMTLLTAKQVLLLMDVLRRH